MKKYWSGKIAKTIILRFTYHTNLEILIRNESIVQSPVLNALSGNEPGYYPASINETRVAVIEPVAGPRCVSSSYGSKMKATVRKGLFGLSSSSSDDFETPSFSCKKKQKKKEP